VSNVTTQFLGYYLFNCEIIYQVYTIEARERIENGREETRAQGEKRRKSLGEPK